MRILVLFMLCFTTSASAQHVSNGGNFISTEFITRARLIYNYLDERPDHAVNKKINLQTFQKAINSTVVEVSSTLKPLDTLGREADAVVLPYPCSSIGTCKIFLRREFWNKALRSNTDIYRLIFHEYLRVMGKHDENNEISALLQIDASFFGREGIIDVDDLANLDFETSNAGFELPLFWYTSSVNVGYWLVVDTSRGFKSDSSLVISSDYNKAPSMIVPNTQAFGTAIQCFDAKPYWDKAIHLSGYVETTNLLYGSAGLWMRVDFKHGTATLDNMSNRSIYGTTPWKRSDVILYVEKDKAEQICFGALLMGVGSARFDELRVRVIDEF
jgi:hypothetical protein